MTTSQVTLVQSGFLTIGVDASPPPPFHSGEPGSPEFCGFEVDLTRAIASRVGLTARYRSALWTEILGELEEGKLDLVCTAATITEERLRRFDFSEPYLAMRLALVTKAEGAAPCKRIGVRIGTVAEEFTRKEFRESAIRTFHMNVDAYSALRQGDLDAVVDDSPIAAHFVTAIPGLKLARTFEGTEARYGLVFAKGSALRAVVNEAMAAMRADGSFAAFERKWFGKESGS